MTHPIRPKLSAEPRPPQRATGPAAPAAKVTPAAAPATPPASPSAGADSAIAQGLGTGNLPALDQVIDAAVAAVPPQEAPQDAPPPPTAMQLALKKAVAGDPEAEAAVDRFGDPDFAEPGWQGRSVGAQLLSLARQGKAGLVKEIVKDLESFERAKALGAEAPVGDQLMRLSGEQPARFVSAMANLARNGFAAMPGGEKLVMTPGPAGTFAERLKTTARLVSPQQSAAQAIAASRNVFYTRKADWEVVKRDSDRRIEADANDVNAMTTAEAAGQVRRNAAAVQAALGRLTPGDRADYEAVAKAVATEPNGELSLQAMLLAGKLPGKARAHDGQGLLASLKTLSEAPLHDKIPRAMLMSDLIQELHRPDAINQHDRGCCTMASVQIKLAKENPAEAVRIITGLASPDGKVTFANGDTLEREPGTEVSDNSNRSISARLFQPAMMEYANGDLDYDNSMTNKDYEKLYREREGLGPDEELEPQDLHSDGSGGLGLDGVHRALNALSGGKARTFTRIYEAKQYNPDPTIFFAPHKQLIQRLQEGLQMGLSMPVGMSWGSRDANGKIHGGHEVLVTGLKDGRVYYNNPWGQKESMPLAKFTARTDEISVVSLARLGR